MLDIKATISILRGELRTIEEKILKAERLQEEQKLLAAETPIRVAKRAPHVGRLTCSRHRLKYRTSFQG